MATFWVMSGAFVLGHGELAYYTIPVAVSLHTLYQMYLFKLIIIFIAYFNTIKKGTSPGYLLGCSLYIDILLDRKAVYNCLMSYNEVIEGFKGVQEWYKRTYKANGEGGGGAHPSLRSLEAIIKVFVFLAYRPY